jgi:DNA-nicking Smr family endonuclease
MCQKKELRGRGLSEFSKSLSEFRRPRCFFPTHRQYEFYTAETGSYQVYEQERERIKNNCNFHEILQDEMKQGLGRRAGMDRENDKERIDDYSGIDFGYECDLHFFEPRETAAVVEEFLRQAAAKGLRKIRLVHGKGTSAKKREVYELLERHRLVAGFCNDGPNWGATIITLKLIDDR